jgi:phage-related protein
MRYFETIFLEGAREFIDSLDTSTKEKLQCDIDIAEQTIDVKRFKKLRDGIWEFRVRGGSKRIRILAFWDKTGDNARVVATHGFIKKVSRVPENEIERARNIRIKYYGSKK